MDSGFAYYLLDEQGNVQETTDVHAFYEWYERAYRNFETTLRVARTELPDSSVVSTVFVPLSMFTTKKEHAYLWETLVFGGPLDEARRSYTSKDDALVGHYEVVAACQEEIEALRRAEMRQDGEVAC